MICSRHLPGMGKPDLIFTPILPKIRVTPFSFPQSRTSMESPVTLKHRDHGAKYAWGFLGIVLFVFALLCAVGASGQDLTATATRDFYPQALARQLRQIVESPADEVKPLRETCTVILDDLNKIILHLERSPAEPCAELQQLEQTVETWDALRESWTITASVDDEQYIPSAMALEEISLALQRRIFVWKSLLKAETAEASPITTLYEKTHDDINRLKERTLAVEQYLTSSRRTTDRQMGQTWCNYLDTQSWLTELEACQESADPTIRRVSLGAPALPVEILKTLSHRANTTLHRLDAPALTDDQRAFLNNQAVSTWKEELHLWSADLVTPISVLRFLEQYETTGGTTDMKAFARFIDQLSDSKTPEYCQLGENVRRQYGMANFRCFVSNALLNILLPPTVQETASFRDIILDQPTVGRRQTDTELAVSLIAHPTRLLSSLEVQVDLATYSRSDAFATQLFNTGQASVIARKTIELTEKGFVTEPCEASIAEHRIRLVGMKTDFDNVPILSRVFRNVVFDQYEFRKPDASAETRRKILRQVRNQVDREVEKRLLPINEKITELSQYANDEFGLQVTNRNSQTEEDWLISSWGVRNQHALMGNTPPPATQLGSFADLKIHESLLNTLIGSLEFEGKRGSVGEFKELLAEKLKQPGLAAPEENDDVEITFAPHNPVVVQFRDGRAELTISIAALRLNRVTHRNFQVIVRYKPVYDSEGQLVLKRDGYISLINVRAQVVMRAAFGKIFPEGRVVPLVPKVLENDAQFDYLTTGHCRIENGWFALALVEKEKE